MHPDTSNPPITTQPTSKNKPLLFSRITVAENRLPPNKRKNRFFHPWDGFLDNMAGICCASKPNNESSGSFGPQREESCCQCNDCRDCLTDCGDCLPDCGDCLIDCCTCLIDCLGLIAEAICSACSDND